MTATTGITAKGKGKKEKGEAGHRTLSKKQPSRFALTAPPLDVLKGFAFPISWLVVFRSGEAEPRRCERIIIAAFRKAGGFPHIGRQSRETVP
jgi:hypothetical protein